MHRKHHAKQPKPSENRTAHKFQQHFQPRKVKTFNAPSSTNAMLQCLTEISSVVTNDILENTSTNLESLINSINSFIQSNHLSRQTRSQMQLSLMWLLVIGVTVANATKIIPEANSCPAGRPLGTLDYLGNGRLTLGDSCSAGDIQGSFDQSCKTVGVIDEYTYWGEVCKYAIDCISRASGELQHHELETTWRSSNGYNLSYNDNTLSESWKKSNGFFGYDGFYTKDVPRKDNGVCEIPSNAEYFKLTQ